MLKVQDERDQIIVAKLYEAAQEHVFDFWEELTREQRRTLLDQLDHLDLQLLARLDRLRHDTRKHTRAALFTASRAVLSGGSDWICGWRQYVRLCRE